MQVLKEDEIWSAAAQVYKDLPSCKIVSGFIQAYMLSDRIIEHKGDNTFLAGGSGGIRTGASNNFYPTDKGLTRKDGRTLPALNTTYLIDREAEDVPELVVENAAVGELSEDVGMVENI